MSIFTDCPSCKRQFRLHAQHLSAAAGQVRCGFCGTQFNALARLRDAPLARSGVPEQAIAEPEFDLPDPEPAEEPHLASHGQSGTPLSTGPEEIPDGLGFEPEPAPGIWSRLLWGLGILLMLAAGAAQAAWFNRDALLQHFPQARPWAKQLCDRLQCQLFQHRDLTRIKVLSRDVRAHPRFQNTLLVNATIANMSSYAQPFPRVRLMLFDTSGRVIAWRDFTPGEYLDASMDVEHGMEPRTPVHFVLEVTGATEGAVSFEFGFL